MTAEDKYLKDLGLKIRSIRIKQKLRQEDVEELSGVDYKYYQKIEAGTQNPSIRVLYKLAKALELKVRDLLP